VRRLAAYARAKRFVDVVIGPPVDTFGGAGGERHMRPGQPATVVADVLPGKVFQGELALAHLE
jgi:hypothetical protein